MLNHFQILSVTHKKLNLNDLGNFVMKGNDDEVLERLKSARLTYGIQELQYLSTCNRVMFLICCSKPFDISRAKDFFIALADTNQKKLPIELDNFIDLYSGRDAVEYLFEVASSIDSLVVGEREILRQYRDSYSQCLTWGLTGDTLRMVERYTTKAAKSVYAKTKIGERPVSVVSLSIEKLFEYNITHKDRILLIGAGDTNRLVCKILKKHNFDNITIFNRSLDNANDLASEMQVKALHLSALENYSEGFDCIIACTASTDPIINLDNYGSLLAGDTDRKTILDLSVPNNVDRSIQIKYDLNLIDIEDIRKLAERNLSFRKGEVTEARGIIKKQAQSFEVIFQQRQIEKAFAKLPQAIGNIKHRALDKVFKKQLDTLDNSTLALVEEMMAYMEKKCVAIPMKVAKGVLD